jgi:hypothetical protein
VQLGAETSTGEEPGWSGGETPLQTSVRLGHHQVAQVLRRAHGSGLSRAAGTESRGCWMGTGAQVEELRVLETKAATLAEKANPPLKMWSGSGSKAVHARVDEMFAVGGLAGAGKMIGTLLQYQQCAYMRRIPRKGLVHRRETGESTALTPGGGCLTDCTRLAQAAWGSRRSGGLAVEAEVEAGGVVGVRGQGRDIPAGGTYCPWREGGRELTEEPSWG